MRDLDSLVAAHDAYVGGILRKALLGDGTLGEGTRPEVQRELQAALRSILDLAGPVKRLHELVCSHVVVLECLVRVESAHTRMHARAGGGCV